MGETKWTPGPWWVEDRRKGGDIGRVQVQAAHRGPGSSCCVASTNNWEAPLANAYLISAAPELYEALAGINGRLAAAVTAYRPLDLGSLLQMHMAAQAALAKADGQAGTNEGET